MLPLQRYLEELGCCCAMLRLLPAASSHCPLILGERSEGTHIPDSRTAQRKICFHPWEMGFLTQEEVLPWAVWFGGGSVGAGWREEQDGTLDFGNCSAVASAKPIRSTSKKENKWGWGTAAARLNRKTPLLQLLPQIHTPCSLQMSRGWARNAQSLGKWETK